MLTVQRVEHESEPQPPPLELSEATLAELVAALDASCDGQFGRRQDSRLRVQGHVMMTPLESADHSPRQVGVYDISRGGIAIVDDTPMAPGEQFTVLLPRSGQAAVEMICTARHSRDQGSQFVIGARYGATPVTKLNGNSIAAVLRARGAAPPA